MSRMKYAIAFALALVMALGAVGVASAAVPVDSSELRDAVTVEGILEHEQEFRSSPTPTAIRGPREPQVTMRRRTTSPAGWRALDTA